MSQPNESRYISSDEHATAFLVDAASLPIEQLHVAASVMRAIADADTRPLERAVSTDRLGHPIMTTEEQHQAWAVRAASHDVVDRARAWARHLSAAADRRATGPDE